MLLATVAIDPPIVAALGAIFTLLAARSIAAAAARREPTAARYTALGAGIGAWFAACFGYHAIKYPAWMLCYAVDPARLPTLVWYPIFFAVLTGCGALGGYLAQRLVARGKRGAAWALAAALVAVWLVLFALTLQRYLVIGTYAEFVAGRAQPLSAQPEVIKDFNLISVVTAVGPVAALVLILRRQRQLKSSAPAAL